MKKLSSFIFASLLASTLLSQTIEIPEAVLKAKLDSIVIEGNQLYKYEKAAWVSTDLFMDNKMSIDMKDYAGFLVYEDQKEIKVLFIGGEDPRCIAQYSFVDDFDRPQSVRTKSRKLSAREKTLIDVREKISKNIFHEKYGVTIPEGYNPNVILLPFANKYKLYVIMGTSQQNVVPFGNDYLFIANKNGDIESWQKFHSGLIPAYANFDGNKIVESVHSHLKTTPLMTATDICTFKLYAPLYSMDSFSVYSPAIRKYMTYRLKENRIEVK